MRNFLPTILIVLMIAGCARPALPPRPVGGEQDMVNAPAADGRAPLVVATAANEGNWGLVWRSLDPNTLEEIPDREPLPVGHRFVHALAPDGATVAFFSWPSGSHNREGRLHLLDLKAWQVIDLNLEWHDNVSWLAFASNGAALYWLALDAEMVGAAQQQAYALYRHDLDSGETTLLTRFPPGVWPDTIRMLPDGGRLAAYGIPASAGPLTEAIPVIYLVDLRTGAIRNALRLEGVTAGQFRVEEAEAYRYQFLRPGLAWDEDGGRLFVADPASEAVTEVDLRAGVIVRQAPTQARRSLIERLARWWLPRAEAKLAAGASLYAALSPDGNTLYLWGLRTDVTADGGGGWRTHQQSLGLRAIDTSTLTVAAQTDLPLVDARISPDGAYVLAPERMFSSEEGRPVEEARGLHVLDAATMAELLYLEEPGANVFGFSPDGGQALVGHDVNLGSYRWQHTLKLLDLQRLQVTAERVIPGGYVQVVVW